MKNYKKLKLAQISKKKQLNVKGGDYTLPCDGYRCIQGISNSVEEYNAKFTKG